MALFKISKGTKAELNAKAKVEGYCWYTTDDSMFYIDINGTTRQPLNARYLDPEFSYGTNQKPVYINKGVPTQCSDTLDVSITGRAVIATNADVASKLSNTTAIGGTSKPVYFSANGVPVVLSDTKGSAAIPIYMNAGTITACTPTSVFSELSWTAGTTAGPILNLTIATQKRTATIPSASATASGVITTGEQTFAGKKTFNGGIVGNIDGRATIASSADALATARTINGTSFNGTANITTAKWGTARTISISSTAGTTGTSIDGSANASLIVPSTMTGFASITSTNFIGNLTGNVSGHATSSTTADQLGTNAGAINNPVYFTGGKPAATIWTVGNQNYGEHDCNNIASNFSGYYTSNGPATSLGASTNDGAIWSQAYSTSWVAQIGQDYRDGALFVRGKNSGTWTSWLAIPHSTAATVGSATKPIYMNAGAITACGDSLAVNITGSAASATSANRLSNTAAIGSATLPVYFNASGVPVACNTTLGVSITGNAATATSATTATKLSNTSAIGSATKPVYFNASGVPTACGDSLAVNITGTAASATSATTATKATQDGSGNTITSTYLKKAGDTASGNIGVIKSSGSVSVYSRRSDTGASVSLMVGSGGVNRGLYDAVLDKWILYSDGADARTALKLYGAVWNDYAEFRTSDCQESGRVICENGDDTLSLATERLQPAGNIISDTFGFAIGETETAKTPIAVSGRVLVYPYEDRYSYNPGDAVCAAPGGTVSKMTREEIITYPERIIGTVSAIPEYETWGEGNVPVNGRIWIKVK